MRKKSFWSTFDVQSPVFRPLWIRIVVFGLTAIWTLVEIMLGNLVWAAIFGAAAAWLGHQFFIAFNPPSDGDSDKG